jgi:hypothetical protein
MTMMPVSTPLDLPTKQYIDYEEFPPGFDVNLYIRQNPGITVIQNGQPLNAVPTTLPNQQPPSIHIHQHQQIPLKENMDIAAIHESLAVICSEVTIT